MSFPESPAIASYQIPVVGAGAICSFKNTKMVTRGRLITDPKKQKLMERYIQLIESALLSAYRTGGAGMPTEQSLQSWIASYVPADDCLSVIPESGGYRVEHVEPGAEGIVILVERLT